PEADLFFDLPACARRGARSGHVAWEPSICGCVAERGSHVRRDLLDAAGMAAAGMGAARRSARGDALCFLQLLEQQLPWRGGRGNWRSAGTGSPAEDKVAPAH